MAVVMPPKLTQEDLACFVDLHETQTTEDCDSILFALLEVPYPTPLTQNN